MTYENGDGTLTDLSSVAESKIDIQASNGGDGLDEHQPDTLGEERAEREPLISDAEVSSAPEAEHRDRAEYERLIRTRFKEFYTDDTQKMINKRFKRYKAMEERIIELERRAEAFCTREAELDSLIAKRCAEVESETERRVVSEMMASRQRACENGYAPRRAPAPFNVGSLTKSQRADIAKRAFGGEKISF